MRVFCYIQVNKLRKLWNRSFRCARVYIRLRNYVTIIRSLTRIIQAGTHDIRCPGLREFNSMLETINLIDNR